MGSQEILAALLWGASLLGIGLGGYGVIRYGYALARQRHRARRYAGAALREPHH